MQSISFGENMGIWVILRKNFFLLFLLNYNFSRKEGILSDALGRNLSEQSGLYLKTYVNTYG